MLRQVMQIDIDTAARPVRMLTRGRLRRLGLNEGGLAIVLAVLIGTITGAAAVGFHELINLIRDLLYLRPGPGVLYGRGMWLLVVFPTVGGLLVGILSRYVFRAREGHGIVDVVESVVRSSGFQRPATAVEKILTSAVTIGSGGSAGAEGPIVQIGAAIASGVGQLFAVTRAQMPVLTGAGCAAGISAIFNAPFGGVLFTLEVILQDFSLRSFTPVVLASVIAQVTTQGILQLINHERVYQAIFAIPDPEVLRHTVLHWDQVGNFALLGIVCGLVGTAFTRTMFFTEELFHHGPLAKISKVIRPAVGGAMLGLSGLVYILIFGVLRRAPYNKPFDYHAYPMPAFFGDGYGAIQQLLLPDFYHALGIGTVAMLAFLCVIKIVGTGITLGSGGSGGVIAPCVFIGATLGALFGHGLQLTHWFHGVQPELYALVAMGAVLAAVVHAPLASILIVFELTQDHKVMLPAMLACIVAVAVARVAYSDSVYTQGLRMRGLHIGAGSDLVLLRRISVEQIPMEPVTVLHGDDPLQQVLDLSAMTSAYDFVVADQEGRYEGMLLSTDINPVLMDREAVPVLVVRDIMRTDITPVRTSDDLVTVLDAFSLHDVNHLPVATPSSPDKVIGLISRTALIRKYHQTLSAA